MSDSDKFDKLNIDQTEYKTRLSPGYRQRERYEPASPGVVTSFIPGTVVEILVGEGDRVSKGDELLVLDAMKMKNRLLSLWDGRVSKIKAAPGDRVTKGAVLLQIETE